MYLNGFGVGMETSDKIEYDSLRAKEEMEASGLSSQASSAIAKELNSLVKNDMELMKGDIIKEIHEMRGSFSSQIESMTREIMSKTTVKIGKMIFGSLGLLITLMTTLHLLR